MAQFIDITPRHLSVLVSKGVLPKEERGRFNPLKVTVAYIRYLRDRKAPEQLEGIESESKTRQGLNVERQTQLRLQNETIRRQRIPLTTIRRIASARLTNVAQLIRSRRGKTLDDHTLNDIFEEITRAMDESLNPEGEVTINAAGLPELDGIALARGRGRPKTKKP